MDDIDINMKENQSMNLLFYHLNVWLLIILRFNDERKDKFGIEIKGKQCKTKLSLNGVYLLRGFNPNQDEMESMLFGMSPSLISNIAAKAYQFWDQQKSFQVKVYKNQLRSKSLKIKELENKLKNQELKYQNKMNSMNKDLTKYRGAAKQWKAKYVKLLQNAKKLQKDLVEKKRQHNILNNKYSDILKKRNSKIPSLPNSVRSRSRSPHKPLKSPSVAFTANSNHTMNTNTTTLPNQSYNHHRRSSGVHNIPKANYNVTQFHPFPQHQNQNQIQNQLQNQSQNRKRSRSRTVSNISVPNPVKFCIKSCYL